jgi:hypothetical protein
MVQRALVVLLGLPIALFAWWGSWELARQVPAAPQAALGAAAFAAIGLVALAAAVLGARGVQR